MAHKISTTYAHTMPNNCPVLDYTAEGHPLGVCGHNLNNGVCVVHGKVREVEDERQTKHSDSDCPI